MTWTRNGSVLPNSQQVSYLDNEFFDFLTGRMKSNEHFGLLQNWPCTTRKFLFTIPFWPRLCPFQRRVGLVFWERLLLNLHPKMILSVFPSLRGRLHEPGLTSNPGQLTTRGLSFFLFTWTRAGCYLRHLFPTRVSFAQPGLTRAILIDDVNMFFRPIQFLTFVWQFSHRFNRYTFAYAKNQRNHVRKEVAIFIIHLRFLVFETDNQVCDLCAWPQT